MGYSRLGSDSLHLTLVIAYAIDLMPTKILDATMFRDIWCAFCRRMRTPSIKTTSSQRRLLVVVASAGVLCAPLPVLSQTPQVPTAATNAVVRTSTLNVFAEMDASSNVVRSLAEGDSVYVDLRVDQGIFRWCGVRIAGQSTRIGFVDCRSLQRVGVPPSTADRTAAKTGSARIASTVVPLAQPAMPTRGGYAAIQSEVVKDGVIDSGYITTMEAKAKTGGATAVTRAALAHFAAGEFALSQRELDQAIEHFEAMGSFAGSQRDLQTLSLLGRGYALLLKSEFSSALELIEKARKLSPGLAQAAALAGWARYRLNQTDEAIADLQTAQRLQPNAGVAQLLAQVTQDKNVEGDFREGESSHFIIRYHGGASRQLASEVTRTLEDQFQTLRAELHYNPPEPISVILYTEEAFRDVTRVPGWTGGANDGRIRVPVQGMDSVSPELANILKHELTHSFLFQKTAGHCPTWLHEGLAQWMEGRRSRTDAANLVALFEAGKGKQLRYYDGSWMHMTEPQARFAYAWALAVVESIEAQSGPDAIDRLLDAERTESSGDAALLEGLRTNLSELDDTTIAYLRRTYLQ